MGRPWEEVYGFSNLGLIAEGGKVFEVAGEGGAIDAQTDYKVTHIDVG